MIVWLFLLLLTASYTAKLTSILTISQLPSAITGIDSLRASELPIGYQAGTSTFEYLTYSLGMSRPRLVPLHSTKEYEKALLLGPTNWGGVVAIVDEPPYIELFLAERTGFKIVGEPFMHRGWGFGGKSIALKQQLAAAFVSIIITSSSMVLNEVRFLRRRSRKTFFQPLPLLEDREMKT